MNCNVWHQNYSNRLKMNRVMDKRPLISGGNIGKWRLSLKFGWLSIFLFWHNERTIMTPWSFKSDNGVPFKKEKRTTWLSGGHLKMSFRQRSFLNKRPQLSESLKIKMALVIQSERLCHLFAQLAIRRKGPTWPGCRDTVLARRGAMLNLGVSYARRSTWPTFSFVLSF